MLQVNNGVHFVEEEPILLQNAVRLCNQATDRNSAQRYSFLFFLRLMEMLPSPIFFFYPVNSDLFVAPFEQSTPLDGMR